MVKAYMKRLTSAIVIVVIALIVLSGCGSSFNRSVKAAIDDGSITAEMMNTSYLDDNKRSYLTSKLTQFQKEDDVEKALALIYAAPEGSGLGDNSFLDGVSCYASNDFINWVKREVLSDAPGTSGYQFSWKSSMIMNQFTFKKADSDLRLTVLTKNDFAKYSGKRYQAGVGEQSDSVEKSFSNMGWTADELGYSGGGGGTTKKTCPNCNGTGMAKTYSTNDPLEEAAYIECPMCHGSGKA